MAQANFEISQLQRGELTELIKFLQLAYPGEVRRTTQRFLSWYFLRNPNIAGDDLPFWIVRNGDNIVGQLATIPVWLKVGNSYTKSIWILEFILLEQFRGKGLGKQLVLAARDQYPTMLTLGINEASTRVFKSLGWRELGAIHRYHRMLFAGNAVPRLGNSRALREGLNLLSFPLRRAGVRRKTAGKYQIRRGVSFGPELDELWARSSAQWTAAVRRDYDFTAWQFLQQPEKVFDVILLYEQQQLVGYAILFFRLGIGKAPAPKAAISDIVYDSRNPDEVVDTLVSAALDVAIERKAGSLVVDILDARVEASLQNHGFSRIKISPRFMVSSSDFQETLYKPENWYLTRADSDISIFEEPNVREA